MIILHLKFHKKVGNKLVKGRGRKVERNVLLFPSPGREGKGTKIEGNGEDRRRK